MIFFVSYSTNIEKTTLTCNEYGVWKVTGKAYIGTNELDIGGISGETCVDFKPDDDELWCQYPNIPKCVDRTVKCSTAPNPDKAYIKVCLHFPLICSKICQLFSTGVFTQG